MEEIIKCIDKFFPKGKDKRRGDALVLQAVAYLEGKKEERQRIIKLIDKRIKNYKKLNKKFPKNQSFVNMWTALFELKDSVLVKEIITNGITTKKK